MKRSMELILKSEVKQDEYTNYIRDTFDLKVSDTAEVHIPNNLKLDRLKDWNVGVICGASGSGKSTILRSLGEVAVANFDEKKPLISNFAPMSPKEAANLLSSMGLASVPTWIRPFHSLSNGEQYRAELAKKVSKGSGIILVDEYTSVVDRNVAKSMSNALQKYIRRENKQIILATCHYDIFEWLQPDWIYDLNKGGTLEKGDCLRQGRPQIQLQCYRTEYDTWNIFKKHHYMTSEMNKSAMCFCFTWEDKLVGFASILPQIGRGVGKAMRMSRLVVLPDYQGLGIGRKILDFIGGICKNDGFKFFIKTINPRLGIYMENSDSWKPTPHNGKQRQERSEVLNWGKYRALYTRPSYCFQYVGENIKGYENLMLHIDDMRRIKNNEGQLTLFDL